MGMSWLGPILQNIGAGVATLPQQRREREQFELDKELRRKQMEQTALEMSLAQERSAREREAALRDQTLHDRNLRTAEFNEVQKVLESMPGGSTLTPDLQKSADKFGFRYNKPNMGVIQNDHDDPTFEATSVPFESQALLRTQITEQGRNQRFADQQELRRQQLAQDARIAAMVDATRRAGLAIDAQQLQQRIAEFGAGMSIQQFNMAIDAWEASFRANAQQAMADVLAGRPPRQTGAPPTPPQLMIQPPQPGSAGNPLPTPSGRGPIPGL